MLVLRWPLSLINILPDCGADDALLGPLFGRTGGCQHPAAHHADSIANAQQLGQIRTNKEDSLAGGGQLSHQPVNLRLAADVDATRWEGERLSLSTERTKTRPDFIRSRQKQARKVSVRPAPIKPAIPRISPSRKTRSTERGFCCPASLRTSNMARPGVCALCG